MSIHRKVLEVDQAQVDLVSDAIKWAIVLSVFYVYDQLSSQDKSVLPEAGYVMKGMGSWQGILINAVVLTAGFAIAHVISQKVLVIVPPAAHSTYYWSRKKVG
jgi:hypothetical protein